MNNIKVIMTIILIFVFFVNTQYSRAMGNRNVIGNGNVTTQTRKIADYDILKVGGQFDVVLVSGKEDEIVIKGEENIIPLIEVEVYDKTLNINLEKRGNIYARITLTKPLTITVPFEDINTLHLRGSGSIISKDTITADDEVLLETEGSGNMAITSGVKAPTVRAVISGSGDIDAYGLQSQDVLVEVKGSGDIVLKGTTNMLTCSIEGSGDIDTYGLQSQDVLVKVEGSGVIKTTVANTLKGSVSGSGNVYYKGDTKKPDISITGSGEIINKN